MSRSIVYDGLNLALKSGTGIATYTRGLFQIARTIGFRTDLLHSIAGRVPKNAMLREIVLFDDDSNRRLSTRKRLRRWMLRQIGAPMGLKPASVKLNGMVVAKSFNTHLAEAGCVHVVEDLFGRAHNHFRRFQSPLKLKLGGSPDILHCTYPMPIVAKNAPTIYTVHDLVPLKLPYLSEDDKRLYYRMMRSIASKADHIVTVSETSRQDIVRFLGVDEKRVTNTYQSVAVPQSLREKPSDRVAEEIEGAFDLEYNGYFLFFGALEPKKNVMRLIEAYLSANVDLPLVIVGAQGWRSDTEREVLKDDRFGFYQRSKDRIRYRRQVRRFDYVSYPLLVSLIRGARAVVFPSLYEGFGLPVLEAMQLGTPVISSTEGSIPEIAGEAAMLVDPYDTASLSQAIRALAQDADLRTQLAEAGPHQAAKFSPKRYRDAVSALYDNVLDG